MEGGEIVMSGNLGNSVEMSLLAVRLISNENGEVLSFVL